MFNLEKSIVEWRRQMLNAGLSASTLDELQSHLREEVERQIQSGASEQEAFQRTVLQIGQAKELKKEFAKAGNFLAFPGSDTFAKIRRILGILWLVLCSLAFLEMSHELIVHLTRGRYGGLLLGLLLWAIYGAGTGGSILVIRGSKPGRRIVGIIAALFTLISLFVLVRLIPTIQVFSVVKVSVFTVFYTISSCLMFLPSDSSAKPARK